MSDHHIKIPRGIIVRIQTIPSEDHLWEDAKGQSEYNITGTTHGAKVEILANTSDDFERWLLSDGNVELDWRETGEQIGNDWIPKDGDQFFHASYFYTTNRPYELSALALSEVVQPPIIQPPTLLAPQNGVIIPDYPVRLTWWGSDAYDSYLVGIKKADQEGGGQIGVSGNELVIVQSLENTDYCWRVKGIKNGIGSEWSDYWKFTFGVPEVIEGVTREEFEIFLKEQRDLYQKWADYFHQPTPLDP
jgi:hypothetical protein